MQLNEFVLLSKDDYKTTIFNFKRWSTRSQTAYNNTPTFDFLHLINSKIMVKSIYSQSECPIHLIIIITLYSTQ